MSDTEICFCFLFPRSCATLFLCASYQWSITMVLDMETCFCVQHRNLFPCSFIHIYGTLFLCASYQWSITTVLDTETCFCVCYSFLSLKKMSLVHNYCDKTKLWHVPISLSQAIICLINWINHNIPAMRKNVGTIQYPQCT